MSDSTSPAEPPKLRVTTVSVGELRREQVDRMWAIYDEHYDNVRRSVFDRDLAEKSLVFLGTDADTGEIVGFSTARFFEHRHAGRLVGIFYSGDTVFLPAYWGQTGLHRAVLGRLLRWRILHPLTPLYWFMICSGLRTFLILVRNWPEHWPHHLRPTPRWERGLIDSVSRRRFGEAWKPERQVVSYGAAQPLLKPGVAPATPDLLALPEVDFFTRINPGYAEGDELALIARVDLRAAVGIVAKWLRRMSRGRARSTGRVEA